ncbi:MAG: GH1 family beta-glucosidase [Phycisphaerae bacterium]
MAFPQRFIWGAATASYQIEGAANKDGKGESIWDSFCSRDGTIFGGHDGRTACDHYHRFDDDVRLMSEIGLQGYRFSLSWSRIFPDGVGALNQSGLDFYERLVDALLARNIVPFPTLYHWDLPLRLQLAGGWLNPDIVSWFGDYAEAVVRRFGDRITHWTTLNEPQMFVHLGHQTGEHAPGLKLSRPEVLMVSHHALRAHGRAVRAIRDAGPSNVQVGIGMAVVVKSPIREEPEQVSAARASMFDVAADSVMHNTWWLDPIFEGRYPEAGIRAYGRDLPNITNQGFEDISQPIDFIGVNIYVGQRIEVKDGVVVEHPPRPGDPMTTMGWPVTPEALYWGPRFIQERYAKPIYVLENGMAMFDWVTAEGQIHDMPRIDFLRRYLLELRRAIEDGVDIRGYFHWSLMDNFEWAEGFKQRFGLVHVDFDTLVRTPKESAFWYEALIGSNGSSLDEDPSTILSRQSLAEIQ